MKSSTSPLVFAACLSAILILCACSPAAPVAAAKPGDGAAAPLVEPTTTSAPLPSPAVENPAPSPAEPTLAPDCSLPGDRSYQARSGDYCFIYPSAFEVNQVTEDFFIVEGPALDDNTPEPMRVIFSLEKQPLAPEADLTRLVDAYLTQSMFQNLPWVVERSDIMLGGVPAQVLEDVPGRMSSRLVMAIHNDMLYTLTFFPSDVPDAASDLDELYAAVTGSFLFQDNHAPAASTAVPVSAEYFEFDRSIRFQNQPGLALWLDTLTTEAVPATPDDLYPGSSPAYAVFRLLGYSGGIQYQLPYPLSEARLMVFRTADFAGFGDNLPGGYNSQKDGLSFLLMGGVDASFCDQPHTSPAQALPFLPYLNSAQVFCAKPTIIEFEGGRGIRYLTAYSQDVGPVLDWFVFYTFQGLTDDGQYYVSAAFPVQTGVFPLDSPANFVMGEQASLELSQQLTSLEEMPENEFYPPLSQLDQMVKSIQIK